MMFANLETLPPDPILGVTAAFRADPSPDKIDLGVGVYRDDVGNTPVLAAVREAERELLARQSTKTYVGPAGNVEFNAEYIDSKETVNEIEINCAKADYRVNTVTEYNSDGKTIDIVSHEKRFPWKPAADSPDDIYPV